MNTERMKRVRECVVNNSKNGMFCYETLGFPSESCGTPGCVAGWAAYLAVEYGDFKYQPDLCVPVFHCFGKKKVGVVDAGRCWLDLTASQTAFLFFGDRLGDYEQEGEWDAADAIRRIDYLLETEES